MFPTKQKIVFDVSWSALAKIGAALALGWGFYLSRDVLVVMLSGLIISALFNPAVDFLEKTKFPVRSRFFGLFFDFRFFGVVHLSWWRPVFHRRNPAIGTAFPDVF